MRIRRTAAFATLTLFIAPLFLFSPAATAASAGWDATLYVENDDTRSMLDPHVATDFSGNALATWIKPGTDDSLFGALYAPATGWGAIFTIASTVGWDVSYARIAMDPGGNATAVWIIYNATLQDAWAARYTPGGGWAAAQMLNTEADGNATFSQIAADPLGNAFAAWRTINATNSSIHARRFTPGGGWGADAVVVSGSITNVPRIGCDLQGRALLTWVGFGPWGLHSSTYVPGQGWGNSSSLGGNGGVAGGGEDTLAVSANGDAMAAWYEYNGSNTDSWAAHYTPGGGWENATIIENTTFHSWMPDVGADSNGNFLVAWNNQSGTYSSNYARWFRPLSGWGAITLIEANDTAEAGSPVVAVDGAGNAWAAWRSTPNLQPDNLRMSAYVVGAGWGSDALLELENNGSARDPGLSAWGSGNVVAVWAQANASTTQSILSRQFRIPPDTTPPAIVVATPLNNSVTNRSTIWVNGSTEPGANLTVGSFEVVLTPNGTFNLTWPLLPGSNSINLTARDIAGNADTVLLVVTFNDPVPGLQQQIAQAQAQVANLSGLLNQTRAELDQTQAQLNATLLALAATQANMNTTRADLNASNIQLAGLRAELNQTLVLLDSVNATLSQTEASLADQGDLLNESLLATSGLGLQLNTTRADLAAKAAALETLSDILNSTRAQLNQSGAELAASRADTARLSESLNRTRNDLSAANETLRKNGEKLDSANAALAGVSFQVTLLLLAVMALIAVLAISLVIGRRRAAGAEARGPAPPEGRGPRP